MNLDFPRKARFTSVFPLLIAQNKEFQSFQLYTQSKDHLIYISKEWPQNRWFF